MLAFMQTLSVIFGVVGILSTFVVSIIIGRFSARSAIVRTANDTQEMTINALQATILALQADVSTLQRRVDDLTRENSKLELTINTVCMALKIKKNLVISIQGDFVSIEDRNGATITSRIHEKDTK